MTNKTPKFCHFCRFCKPDDLRNSHFYCTKNDTYGYYGDKACGKFRYEIYEDVKLDK